MNFILAEFKCRCTETGVIIKKNDPCLYDLVTNKVYSKDSAVYKEELEKSFQIPPCIEKIGYQLNF